MNSKEQSLKEDGVLRSKAEEQLAGKPIKSSPIGAETDLKRLVHELRVHQIELEMQNEELRMANERAEKALKKYAMMYDFAPMGYFTLDSEGAICDLNYTGAEMLGEKRFSLIGSNFRIFVSEDSLPVYNNFFSGIFSSNLKESCNVVLGYDKKFHCPVYMEGVVTGDNQECLLSVIDLSVIKK
ncbi:MAG: PAS domain-containing protein [Bacteroidales bacterium]|nr:PAS domain-containing protein [Bacteroidales bacterium]MCF8455704.1 PAS domain-containing protein [Bacteroidales bacterium]